MKNSNQSSLWRDSVQEIYFLIPEDQEFGSGNCTIHQLKGIERQVDPDAIATYEISAKDAEPYMQQNEESFMWLEDQEINYRLQSNSATAITEAIEAILLRWQSGDRVVIEPLRAELLKPYTGKVPTEVLNPFLDFLLGVEGVSALPPFEAYQELAKAIAFFINTPEQYVVALRLKVDRDSIAVIHEVIDQLNHLLIKVEEDRIPHIEFFLSCLLDGKSEVRKVTIDSLVHWSKTPASKVIIRALFNELTEEEQKLLEHRPGEDSTSN